MSGTITGLLISADAGDADAKGALFSSLYTELHRAARRALARPGYPPTVGATTLLHEAYLEIAQREGPSFSDRSRFMAYAGRVMRGLIIDHARRRRAVKRGSGFELTAVDTDMQAAIDAAPLTAISDGLDALGRSDPSLAELVDLKFFCGFSFAEIAAMRGTSERTVQRHWEKARIFLYHAMSTDVLP